MYVNPKEQVYLEDEEYHALVRKRAEDDAGDSEAFDEWLSENYNATDLYSDSYYYSSTDEFRKDIDDRWRESCLLYEYTQMGDWIHYDHAHFDAP